MWSPPLGLAVLRYFFVSEVGIPQTWPKKQTRRLAFFRFPKGAMKFSKNMLPAKIILVSLSLKVINKAL